MKFDTYIPCDGLKPFVRSFVIQEMPGEETYKVLPDTGLVIGFQYNGRLSYLQDEREIGLSPYGVTGLRDGFRVFKNSGVTSTVLVFFREGGAAAFFQQPLHELFRESVSLENFMPRSELLRIEEQLCEAKTDRVRIRLIEQVLLARIGSFQPDLFVSAALQLIHKSKGTIRITELAKRLHTSQSPLEKRFRKAVGASPKKFASIVRLKHAIETFHPENSLTGLGYESGYYDQAHFIRQFKTFTGQTPGQFFRSR